MQIALSTRIAQLSISQSVTTSPRQLKADILDLAKDCQVLPEQKFLLRVTARSMTPLVRRVFGPIAMIFPLTETGRRHVYLAVLAKLDADDRLNEMEEPARISLLEKLLTLRNADLILAFYGSNPQGFLRLITRLGDVGRGRQFYLDLHTLLTEAPELAAPLLAATDGGALSDTLLDMVVNLPHVPVAVKLAPHFSDRDRLETFLQLYTTLSGSDHIEDKHMSRITAGESPDRIIEDLWLSYPFPAPLLQGHPDITFIHDGNALFSIAKTFKNCLRNFVAEAIRGERQYYIWRMADAADVVFAIQEDAPFGWFMIEAKHAENRHLTPEMEEKLRVILMDMGVTRTHSVEQMTQPFLTCDDDHRGLFDW